MIATWGVLVDQTGQECLAGASFTAKEHGEVMLRRHHDGPDEWLQTRSLGRNMVREGFFERVGAGDVEVTSWTGQTLVYLASGKLLPCSRRHAKLHARAGFRDDSAGWTES